MIKNDTKIYTEVNEDKLQQYELDAKSIKEFRSEIQENVPNQKELVAELENLILSYFDYPDENMFYDKLLKLIMSGVDVNCHRTLVSGPLTYAILKGHFKAFIALLKAGANINFRNGYGVTPLMVSLNKNRVQMFEILLMLGADPNIKNNNGKTVYDFARQTNNKIYLEMLELEMLKRENETKLQRENYKANSSFDITESIEGKSFDEVIADAGKQMKKILGNDFSRRLGDNYE